MINSYSQMSNASLPIFKGIEYVYLITNKMELVYVPALVKECTVSAALTKID